MPAPPPANDRRCNADPRCRRAPRFQVQLHQAPGQSQPDRTADTCADHLGDTVQALTQWASTTGFGSGLLQVSVVGPPTGDGDPHPPPFPFATIQLPP
jgi:hypothetical protein